MCSNISTDTIRSNRPGSARSLTSAVTTSTFAGARASIHSRCTCEFEHRVLGLGQRAGAVLPEAGAVLQPRAEDELEELRRLLIVLLVRRGRVPRDGRGSELFHEGLLRLGATTALRPQPPAQVRADREPEHALGDHVALECAVDETRPGAAHPDDVGGRGTNAL